MSDTVGHCNHTGFREYDHLSGYVTGNYVSEWTGRDGTRWRTVTTVINLGRRDKSVPVDPNAASKPERMPYTPVKLTRNHRADIVANAERKHTDALEIYTAYLREHGPSPMRDLLGLTGWRSRITIGLHFGLFPDVYRFFPTLRLWGLQGQTLEDRHE